MANGNEGLFLTPEEVERQQGARRFNRFLAGSQAGGGGATLGAGIGAMLSGLFNRQQNMEEQNRSRQVQNIMKDAMKEAGGDQLKGYKIATQKLINQGFTNEANQTFQQAQAIQMQKAKLANTQAQMTQRQAKASEALASAEQAYADIQHQRQQLQDQMRRTDIKAREADTKQQRADTYQESVENEAQTDRAEIAIKRRKAKVAEKRADYYAKNIKINEQQGKRRLDLMQQRIDLARSREAKQALESAYERMKLDLTEGTAMSMAKMLAVKNPDRVNMSPEEITASDNWRNIYQALPDDLRVQLGQDMNDFMARIDPEMRFEKFISDRIRNEGFQNQPTDSGSDDVDFDFYNE